MKKIILVFVLCISFSSIKTFAQKTFSEGLIKYDVYRNGGSTPEGIYVITVKAGMIKQEWAMNNGFNNITIYNQKTGVSHSMNIKDDTKYALEITPEELKNKNKRFENAKFTSLESSKKLAGYNTKGNQVMYSNGETVEIFYTPDLIPQNPSYNTMFPGLQGIALEYSTNASKDISFKFVATSVDIKVIDHTTFDIPSNYKIVNRAELEKLK